MAERPDRPRVGRKGNKKVRTGCRTCKIRKVKCDETKPFCLRCTQSGRVCDGYAPVPPRARRALTLIQMDGEGIFSEGNDSESDGTLVARSLSLSLSPFPPSPTITAVSPNLTPLNLIKPSEDGVATLQLFHSRTAPRLAGFMDGFFWNELVLQVADVEPSVRHALAAINSIYEYCEKKGALKREPVKRRLLHPSYAHGLKEYNRAIGELVHRPKTKRPGGEAVHLVCCVLFVCIEMLAGERAAAISHFDQGLQLLAAYGAGNEAYPGPLLKADVVRETLIPIFRRLSLQAIMFGRDPPLLPLFEHMSQEENTRSSVPFRTMDEANDAMVAILDVGLRMVHKVGGLTKGSAGAKYDNETWTELAEVVELHQQSIITDLNKWNANFAPLAAMTVAASSGDPKAKIGCNILRIQHLIAEIWTACITVLGEVSFDSHLVNFGMVVHLASDVLNMEKAFGDAASNPVFVFEMGVIAPLYFTATKCRQRRVRRAALTLLQSWPRRENVWDPIQIYKAAHRMVEIEDKDALDPEAPDDVWPPEWKRIHKMDFDDGLDDEGNPLIIALFSRKPCGLDSEWEVIREVI